MAPDGRSAVLELNTNRLHALRLVTFVIRQTKLEACEAILNVSHVVTKDREHGREARKQREKGKAGAQQSGLGASLLQ